MEIKINGNYEAERGKGIPEVCDREATECRRDSGRWRSVGIRPPSSSFVEERQEEEI